MLCASDHISFGLLDKSQSRLQKCVHVPQIFIMKTQDLTIQLLKSTTPCFTGLASHFVNYKKIKHKIYNVNSDHNKKNEMVFVPVSVQELTAFSTPLNLLSTVSQAKQQLIVWQTDGSTRFLLSV